MKLWLPFLLLLMAIWVTDGQFSYYEKTDVEPLVNPQYTYEGSPLMCATKCQQTGTCVGFFWKTDAAIGVSKQLPTTVSQECLDYP